MNAEQRIKVLEEDLKVLKNEVKAMLLDIREQYLGLQNPFNLSDMLKAQDDIKETAKQVNEMSANSRNRPR